MERSGFIEREQEQANGLLAWFQRDDEQPVPPMNSATWLRIAVAGIHRDETVLLRTVLLGVEESQRVPLWLHFAGFEEDVIAAIAEQTGSEDIDQCLKAFAEQTSGLFQMRELEAQRRRDDTTVLSMIERYGPGEATERPTQPSINRRNPRPIPTVSHLASRARLFGMADTTDLRWYEYALCAQADPEAFYPKKSGSVREAKRVCRSCEVTDQCLEYAMENNERYGVWGGMSVRERRKLEKKRKKDRTKDV